MMCQYFFTGACWMCCCMFTLKLSGGCGNLFGVEHLSLYITNDDDKEVQILPSMDSISEISGDIKDLVSHMRWIINLPRGGKGSLKSSELPNDFYHMLSFLTSVML